MKTTIININKIEFNLSTKAGRISNNSFSTKNEFGKVIFWGNRIKNLQQGVTYSGQFKVTEPDNSKVGFLIPIEVTSLTFRYEIQTEGKLMSSYSDLPKKFKIVKVWSNGEVETIVSYSSYECKKDCVVTTLKKYNLTLPQSVIMANNMWHNDTKRNCEADELNTTVFKTIRAEKKQEVVENLKAGKYNITKVNFYNGFSVYFDDVEIEIPHYGTKFNGVDDFDIIESTKTESFFNFKFKADFKIETVNFTGWLKENKSYNAGWRESSRWDNVDFETHYWIEYVYGDHIKTVKTPIIPEWLSGYKFEANPIESFETIVKVKVVKTDNESDLAVTSEMISELENLRNENQEKENRKQRFILKNNILNSLANKYDFYSFQEMCEALCEDENGCKLLQKLEKEAETQLSKM